MRYYGVVAKSRSAPPPSGPRFLPILLALGLTAAFTLVLPAGKTPTTASVQTIVNLGVEHTKPLRLSIAVSLGKSPSLLRMYHDGPETAYLSLPVSWTLQEVQAATLKDVIADSPTFGFARWHVPSKAIVTFSIPQLPDGAVVFNPSKVPLELKVKRIDLVRNTVENDVLLTSDQPQRIW
jgi:hypothetical protein